MLREWTASDTAAFVRAPGPDDDKYSRGVVALRTGSTEYPGAAVLGVEAAWRSGAGYVRYVGGAADAVLARRPETVAAPGIGRTRPGAWVIGSGTDASSRTTAETAALREVLSGTTPVVVDAGALDLAVGAEAPLVLTPHAGELDRLRDSLGLAPSGSAVDRAVETAERLGATLLLKGAHTVVTAPGTSPIVVSDAPAWLATAGTGDVLAGVIGAVIAANPGRPLPEAAASAAWLHGRAASIASGAVGGGAGHPIVALDVAEALPAAVAELLA